MRKKDFINLFLNCLQKPCLLNCLDHNKQNNQNLNSSFFVTSFGVRE